LGIEALQLSSLEKETHCRRGKHALSASGDDARLLMPVGHPFV